MSSANVTQQDVVNAQLNAKIEILAQEMKDFKDEMREFKNEMRDFKTEMRSIGKHVQNLLQARLQA